MFPGFTDADFDAYRPERASSNTWNRPRLEARQKAVALARSLADDAVARGVSLELRASDEHPSVWNKRSVTEQWVFLWRDAEARRHLEEVLDRGRTLSATLLDPTPFYRHAFLGLRLDPAAVELTLRVHGDAWADVKNLRAVAASPEHRAALVTALSALPDGFALGVIGSNSAPAPARDDGALSASLDALRESSHWWTVNLSVPRPDAVALGPELGPRVAEAFAALLPVFTRVAWSRDNDLISLEKEIAAAQSERAAHSAEVAAEEAASKARQQAEIDRRRSEAVVEARERLAAMERARPEAVHAAVQAIVPAAPPRPAPQQRPPQKPRPPRDPKPAPAPSASRPVEAPPPSAPTRATVAVGQRVQVRSGPFAGRVGTLTELDGRGQARVSFGLLSARVELDALAPAEA